MSHFSCVIQDQGPAHRNEAELERRLGEHHARHIPRESTTVRWISVPHGFMFTEGRPSTSSVIACALSHSTTLDLRETYMRGICDLWTEVTGCTDHEVVVSITEAPPTSEE